MPPLADRQSFERVVRTREPVVGNLSESHAGSLLFASLAARPPGLLDS